MANQNLFQSFRNKLRAAQGLPLAETTNEAGGRAYRLSPEQSLAQYAATGCLNDTFYATAQNQLETVLELAGDVAPEFLTQVALYSRQRGMKEMPALLLAVLSLRSPQLFDANFDSIITDVKMLRNFVQIVRSGVTGRRSLGSLPKRKVQQWLARQSDDRLFRGSVGQAPSLADVIKMVRPRPQSRSREALYAYLVGKPFSIEALPELVQQFEAFKRDPVTASEQGRVPDVPFQMLTSLELPREAWLQIARQAPWQATRINLNTFARRGLFEDDQLTLEIANKLSDRRQIEKSHALPYQLMAAALNQNTDCELITEALKDAMEIALENTPKVEGLVAVCPDVSGSMSSPLTGYRRSATSSMRCVDVAALLTAAIVRKNPEALVLPFDLQVVTLSLDASAPVLENASALAAQCGGGTDVSAPLRELNRAGIAPDLVIIISDNESWFESRPNQYGATKTLQAFASLKQANPKAKLVCIDIQPYRTSQAAGRPDVLNVGGFSDKVFEVIAAFTRQDGDDFWVREVSQIPLAEPRNATA